MGYLNTGIIHPNQVSFPEIESCLFFIVAAIAVVRNENRQRRQFFAAGYIFRELVLLYNYILKLSIFNFTKYCRIFHTVTLIWKTKNLCICRCFYFLQANVSRFVLTTIMQKSKFLPQAVTHYSYFNIF